MKLNCVLMATVALSLSAIVNPTPASAAPARSHHGHVVKVKPSAHASHRAIHRKAHAGKRHSLRRHRYHRSEATQSDNGFGFGGFSSFGGSGGLVDAARSYIGRGNPTARGRLWCAAFMNLVLQRTGHQGTGSDMARSFSSYGQRLSGPQVGAIAVMSRGRRGGHVGVVSGVDDKGNPIIVSGNHGNRVAESVYSKGRVYAYVMPN